MSIKCPNCDSVLQTLDSEHKLLVRARNAEQQLEAEKELHNEAVDVALGLQKELNDEKAARVKAEERADKLQATLDGIASALHYPECWDTGAYPTLLSAVQEVSHCTVCAEPERHGYPSNWATTRKPEVK